MLLRCLFLVLAQVVLLGCSGVPNEMRRDEKDSTEPKFLEADIAGMNARKEKSEEKGE